MCFGASALLPAFACIRKDRCGVEGPAGPHVARSPGSWTHGFEARRKTRLRRARPAPVAKHLTLLSHSRPLRLRDTVNLLKLLRQRKGRPLRRAQVRDPRARRSASGRTRCCEAPGWRGRPSPSRALPRARGGLVKDPRLPRSDTAPSSFHPIQLQDVGVDNRGLCTLRVPDHRGRSLSESHLRRPGCGPDHNSVSGCPRGRRTEPPPPSASPRLI